MSDDGYYPDSPYDEFEEMLWDADPGPNLADDLAQHAAYSPVWQDDPVGELEQYHSDWEYYSDDYFDDDPAILRTNPLEGSPTRKKNSNGSQPAKRGRKRKLGEIYQAADPIEIENKFLKETIQGTVWAKDALSAVKLFQHGQQDKVALLTDWRERFHLTGTKPGGLSTVQLEEDESWANDLGLKDMGLTAGTESSGTQLGVVEEEEDIYTDEDDLENGIGEQIEPGLLSDGQTILVNEEGLSTTLGSSSQHDQPLTKSEQDVSLNADASFPPTHEATEEARGSSARKKRKVSGIPVSPRPQEPNNLMLSNHTQLSKELPKQISIQDTTSVINQSTTEERSRKRKVSCTENETPDTVALNAKRRNLHPPSKKAESNFKPENSSASQPRITRAKTRKK